MADDKKIDNRYIIPENIPRNEGDASVDNLLPEENKDIGIMGDNPVEAASDIKSGARAERKKQSN